MQIPRGCGELLQHIALELGEIAARGAEVGHQFWNGEAEDGVGHVGQRGDEQQAAGIAGIVAPEVGIHDLRNRLALRGNVVGNGVFERGIDLADLGKRLGVVQVQVLDGDEEFFVGVARLPEARGDDAHEPDEGARLLEAGILAEPRIQVLDGGMERVAGFDELGELLRRLRSDVHLFRLAHGLGRSADDHGTVGELLALGHQRAGADQALAENLVKLVGVHLHRRQIHGVAFRLMLELLEQTLNLGTGFGVGAHEVGDHDTDIAEIALDNRLEQVGQGRRGDFREIGIADGD